MHVHARDANRASGCEDTHQTHLSPQALAAASASVDHVRALAPLGARASLCAFRIVDANDERPAVEVAAAVDEVLEVVAGFVEVVAGFVEVAGLVDVAGLVEVVAALVEVDVVRRVEVEVVRRVEVEVVRRVEVEEVVARA